MEQPFLRVARTHNPPFQGGDSPIVDAGVRYLPASKQFDITVTAAGTILPWLIPAGVFITKVVARMVDGLDAGTVDIGVDGDTDAFIDNLDWTETNDNAVAQSLGSSNAGNPNGLYFAAEDEFAITVGGQATSGRIQIVVEYYNLTEMWAAGSQVVA